MEPFDLNGSIHMQCIYIQLQYLKYLSCMECNTSNSNSDETNRHTG